MVGGQHHHGVVPHAVLIQLVEQLAEPVVGHGQRAAVAGANVAHRLLIVELGVEAAVQRPGEVVAVPAVVVQFAVARRTVERLVRIECLQVQVPVFGVVVAVDEVQGALEALRRRVVLVAFHRRVGLVAPVAPAARPLQPARTVRLGRLLHQRAPSVALLAAQELPGAVDGVVALTAGVEVVVVVGDHVAVHAALLAQHGRQAFVPRLHRAPRRLQEVDPPGEHLAARRHARQGAGEVVVEHRAALRQPVDVGRDGELVAVAAQVVAVQGVHDDEDGSHGCGPRVAVSVVRRIMPYLPSSRGLVTSTSRPSKSVTFRVASAKSCAFAVPAISVGARTDCARVEHRRGAGG